MSVVHQGECIDVLMTLESESVDSLVTDPPAGISFMSKEWDSNKGGRDHWVAWLRRIMQECYRVMKPGAHGLVWALPRTSHWTATALENAGFEIRDRVGHAFGSGFPKSLDVSKAIDKAAGEYVPGEVSPNSRRSGPSPSGCYGEGVQTKRLPNAQTDDAKKWQGFGTALKPAMEDWWLIRKPLSEKTVAANVLKHGTGAINVDGCRVEFSGDADEQESKRKNQHSAFGSGPMTNEVYGKFDKPRENYNPPGRFPANLIVSGSARELMDAQSGVLRARGNVTAKDHGSDYNASSYAFGGMESGNPGDSGGASRFFADCADVEPFQYIGKAPGNEKWGICRTCDTGPIQRKELEPHVKKKHETLAHPTVKAIKLMCYLCRMITPPNGIVLDPFCGSGTTGVAAVQEGFRFIGIEREPEYVEIARARIEHAQRSQPVAETPPQLSLDDFLTPPSVAKGE